jgi:hypothetical protein
LELATRKTELQARVLEHRRAVRRGDLVLRPRVTRLAQHRLGEVRALVLSLPTRLAPRFQSIDEDRALALLQA